MKKTQLTFIILTATMLIIMIIPALYSLNEEPIQERIMNPDISVTERNAVVDGNIHFATDMYHKIKGIEGNLFYSPYSISVALAMSYAGAKGNTAHEMKEVLHFTLDDERVFAAFNYIDQQLMSRGKDAHGMNGQPFCLNVANRLWGQKDFDFEIPFLNHISMYFGASIGIVDYKGDFEQARITINDWVSDQTYQKIPELIPKGVLSELTRLVITNAIYFNAAWSIQFQENQTFEDTFYLINGNEIKVPMMNNQDHYRYMQGNDYRAIELNYDGNEISMVIVMPDENSFDDFEQNLNPVQINSIVQGLSSTLVQLKLPKWETRNRTELSGILIEMGMHDACKKFSADFSGMTYMQELYIEAVIHEAFIKTAENGTEAAAATAVVINAPTVTSAIPTFDPIVFNVDHPFLYFIRDIQTNSILFLGRVVNPAL